MEYGSSLTLQSSCPHQAPLKTSQSMTCLICHPTCRRSYTTISARFNARQKSKRGGSMQKMCRMCAATSLNSSAICSNTSIQAWTGPIGWSSEGRTSFPVTATQPSCSTTKSSSTSTQAASKPTTQSPGHSCATLRVCRSSSALWKDVCSSRTIWSCRFSSLASTSLELSDLQR